MAELQKLGLRTVPVLSRGDKYIFGQNTQQIIDFIGLNEDGGPQLSVDELNARIVKFMGAAIELIPLMPTTSSASMCRAGRAAIVPSPSTCSA